MIIKSLFCKDNGRNALYDAQKYVCDELKVPPGGISSYGCGTWQWSSTNFSTKVVFRKKELGKHYHIILGFDPADKVTTEKAIRVAKKIVRHFRDRYVLFAIHTNTGHIHIHFLISYTTIYGKQEGMKKNWLSDFKSFVSGIAEEEHCCPVRMHNKDWKPINGIHSKDGQDDPEVEIDDSDYLGEPEEVLFENVPAASSPKTIFGYPPDYVPQQRTTINYNYTINNNYYSPGYTPNKYGRSNNYNAVKSRNTNQSSPQLPPQQHVFSTDELLAPVEPDFSSVYAPDVRRADAPVCNDEIVIAEPCQNSVPPQNDTIEYGVCVQWFDAYGRHEQEYRFSDLFSAELYVRQCRTSGCTASVYEIRNGRTIPFIVSF